jgi:hypothetical protein
MTRETLDPTHGEVGAQGLGGASLALSLEDAPKGRRAGVQLLRSLCAIDVQQSRTYVRDDVIALDGADDFCRSVQL